MNISEILSGFDDTMKILEHIKEEIAMVVPDWEEYALLQINTSTRDIYYKIYNDCPGHIHAKIEKVILHNAELIGITASTDRAL